MLVTEGFCYVAGSAVAFVGLSQLGGRGWLGELLLISGLGLVAVAGWLTWRRTLTLRVEIEDDHLHPIPVLDAPKGTFDLIAGITVRLSNRSDQPIGVRIDTLLYRRTRWKWDLPVAGAPRVPLLAPSVVPARSAKSFFVKNYTRLPDSLETLGREHFVKLIVDRGSLGKSAHRVFVKKRFELPRESSEVIRPSAAWDDSPLLPFDEQASRNRVRAWRSGGSRLGTMLGGLREARDVPVHPLRETEDSLEGLIDEIEAELEEAEVRDESGSTPA